MNNIKEYIQEKLIINKDVKNIDHSNDPTTWLVGDILCGTAGYSMCLPRFYRILRKTAKSFEVCRIPGKIVSGHRNGQWEEVPDENAKAQGEHFMGRITKWGGLKIDGVSVHLWNGKPLHGDDMD